MIFKPNKIKFLQILFNLAKIKFGNTNDTDLMPAFIKLLAHCDSALRRYGVRSTRLRRAELRDENVEEKQNQQILVHFYLLPSRIPRRPFEERNNGKEGGNGPKRKLAIQKQNSIRAKSLPRKLILPQISK